MIRSMTMQTGPGQANNTSSALQYALSGQNRTMLQGQVGAGNQTWQRQAARMQEIPVQGSSEFKRLSRMIGVNQPKSMLQQRLGTQQQGDGTNITTSISPWQIYSPSDIQQNVNQVAATALGGADPNFAQKQFVRPGMSRDAGTMGAAAPQIGQSTAAARTAMGFLPLADNLTNRQFQLEAEYAKSKEALGLAEALRKLQAVKDYEYAEQINPLLSAVLG